MPTIADAINTRTNTEAEIQAQTTIERTYTHAHAHINTFVTCLLLPTCADIPEPYANANATDGNRINNRSLQWSCSGDGSAPFAAVYGFVGSISVVYDRNVLIGRQGNFRIRRSVAVTMATMVNENFEQLGLVGNAETPIVSVGCCTGLLYYHTRAYHFI